MLSATAQSLPTPLPRDARRGARNWMHSALSNVVWIWLAGLVAIFGIMNPFFFSTSNLQNVLVQATVLGLLGLAQSLVLLVGEIDLSIAAITGISSALGALSIQRLGLPVGIGIGVGVAIATQVHDELKQAADSSGDDRTTHLKTALELLRNFPA